MAVALPSRRMAFGSLELTLSDRTRGGLGFGIDVSEGLKGCST
jgi:hypothetical protein